MNSADNPNAPLAGLDGPAYKARLKSQGIQIPKNIKALTPQQREFARRQRSDVQAGLHQIARWQRQRDH